MYAYMNAMKIELRKKADRALEKAEQPNKE